MAIHLRRPPVTAKPAKPKAVAAEHTSRPPRGKRVVGPGTAAGKPGSFVAPPPDRELDIAIVQSLELETAPAFRSEEHTSELKSLMRISYAVFCLKKKNNNVSEDTYACSV